MFRTRRLKKSSVIMERMEVVTLLKVPVKVLCFGDITPSQIVRNPEKKPEKLVLMIPGNPGVPEFYSDFGARLHEKTRLPVWIVAHGGHSDLPVPRLSQYPHLYNLQGQIRQKRELIDSYLSGVKLRCIGHSIGSKMLLDILKSDEKYAAQMEKVELLFPTIERMAISPAGQFIVKFLNYLYWPFVWFFVIVSFFPNFSKVLLIKLYLSILGYPEHTVPGYLKFFEPRLIRKALDLAEDEMKTVLKRDDETIKKYSKILHFYYGATDLWTPLSYVDDLKDVHPGLNVEIDQYSTPHAFSLNNSKKVADFIAKWWENEKFTKNIS